MIRGTIKSFREYLNAACAEGPKFRERRFHQETRAYGDYLYAQDRDMFDVLLAEALADASKFPDWVRPGPTNATSTRNRSSSPKPEEAAAVGGDDPARGARRRRARER